MSSVISLSTHQFFETESQKPALFAVFSFLEQFFSSSTVVSVAKANVLQTPTIAVFARNWSGADPNFAPFRWRIWLAPSEFLCLLANQNVTFVTFFCNKLPFFCTQLPSFCTLLPKNCISVSQSQSRNFFMYIIRSEVIQVTSKSDEHAARVQFEITSMISVQNCTPLVLKKWCNLKQKGNKMNWCDIINGLVFWYWFVPIEHAGK